MEVNAVEVVSVVCVGISTFVTLKLNASIAQLELRLTKAIGEASGKQSIHVEQARKAASASLQRSRENSTAIGILDGKYREHKGCLETLEMRLDKAGVAR